MSKNILIAVAWPYVNGDLHIGHLAGYLLPSDIYARYHRLSGNNVLMVSGSDCHGTPITLEADKRGLPPEEIVKEYHQRNLDLFTLLNLSYDLYTKTDTPTHKQVTQDIFIAMLHKGYIFKDKTEQYYSQQDNKFLPDRYVEGICPVCKTPGARSDQCDTCGSLLNQGELIDPISKISGSPVELKETEHYFVDWPKLQPFLESYVAKTSETWRPWVKKETEKWLKEGLKPRAITRDLDWGIEIPTDRMKKEDIIDHVEDKRIYVWFDAVIGYLSASIEWATLHNTPDAWKDWWYNEQATHAYFMGKDNLVFHTLFWPGQLHAYDEKLHLPDIPAINQFLTLNGQKFSKSKHVIIDSKDIATTYGTDIVRFYFTTIMPENADADFTWDDFMVKTNNILIGNIANFIYRTVKLAEKISNLHTAAIDTDVIATAIGQAQTARALIENTDFKEYIHMILAISSEGNKYLAIKEPWLIQDKESDAYKKVIATAIQIIILLAALLKPVIPATIESLETMLGITIQNIPDDLDTFIKEQFAHVQITNPKPLFQKIEIPQTLQEA